MTPTQTIRELIDRHGAYRVIRSLTAVIRSDVPVGDIEAFLDKMKQARELVQDETATETDGGALPF